MIRGFRGYMVADMKLTFREPLVLLFQFALPVGMYALFGMMFGTPPADAPTFDYYNDYTSNFVAVTLLNVALMGLSTTLVIYKELGFLKQLMITPMDTSAIWLSAIVKGLIIFLVGFFEIILVGWLMFDKLPHNLIQMLAAIVLSAYCLFSMGFMLGALFKLSNTAFGGNGVIFQVMLLLSGASIPLSQMPDTLQTVSNILPMTHVINILRLGWHGEFFTQAGLVPAVVALVMGTVFAVMARSLFRRTYA